MTAAAPPAKDYDGNGTGNRGKAPGGRAMIFAVAGLLDLHTPGGGLHVGVHARPVPGFLAGLGLGGYLPTAITVATEFARKGNASSATTTVMTGYHVGAVLTAILGLIVLGNGHGWE